MPDVGHSRGPTLILDEVNGMVRAIAEKWAEAVAEAVG